MKTTIALYEALIQANIPAAAARQVADTLEQDMSSVLATKQDLRQLELATKQDLRQLEFATKQDLRQLELATKQDLQHLEQVMNLRFEAVEKHLESRIVVKLGTLMVTLFGLAVTAMKLLN